MTYAWPIRWPPVSLLVLAGVVPLLLLVPSQLQVLAGGVFPATVPSREARLARLLDADAGPIHALVYSPDNHHLATAGADGRVRLWTTAGRFVRTSSPAAPGADDAVWSAAFSGDGGVLAAGRRSGAVSLWDVASGRLLATLPPGESPVTVVAVAPQARLVLIGRLNGSLALWSRATGRAAVLGSSAGHVSAITLGPGGRAAAAWSGGRVEVWDTDGTDSGWRIETEWPLSALAFSRDGAMVAGAGAGGAWVREAADGREVGAYLHEGWFQDVAFSRDGATLTAATRREVRIWQVSDGRLLERINLGELEGRAALSAQGDLAALAVEDGVVHLLALSANRHE